MNRRVALGGGLAALLSPCLIQPAHAQPEGDFANKFLVIYQKSNPKNSSYLEKVHVARLGDRQFLVGTGIDLGNPAFAFSVGLVHWVAVDDISLIQVFDDLDQIKKLFVQAGKPDGNP